MFPIWLHILSIVALGAAGLCALAIAVDLFGRPQHMWIMNLVWPLIALSGGPLALWGYLRYGRSAHAHHDATKPFAVSVGIATSHCGSGCTLGDILAEWLAFAAPSVAVWFGWRSLFGEKMFAVWVLDFIFAFLLGIVFQYFSIAPMKKLGLRDGLWAALRVDALSLIAWQIGMYGFMAFANFYLFRELLGSGLPVNSAEFWFMMQLAMLCGFITAYPVNWWLLRAGIKEEM